MPISALSSGVFPVPVLAFMCSVRLILRALALLLAAFAAGCGSIDHGLTAWRTPEPNEKLLEIAHHLEGDRWREQFAWTPLIDDERFVQSAQQTPAFRWIHATEQQALMHIRKQLDDRSDQEKTAETAPDRPPEPSGQKTAADDEVNALLAEVARIKTLSGWNAAILLAQRDPVRARAVESTLAMLVTRPPQYMATPKPDDKRTPFGANPGNGKPAPNDRTSTRISLNMQSAAAEAWCRVLAASHDDAEIAFAPAGRALGASDLPDMIRGELLRGIALRVAPDRIPRLADALTGGEPDESAAISSAPLRHGAIDACVTYAARHREMLHRPPEPNVPPPDAALDATAPGDESGPWPIQIWNLHLDPDSYMRRRYGEFLAVLGHSRAFSVLKAGLTDKDTDVRDAAATSLGLLNTDDAKTVLQFESQRSEERVRMLAVRGLAFQGEKALAPFVNDKSSIIRRELAVCLGRRATLESARIMQQLLADPSLDVQGAVIAGVINWPENLAAPILLQALAECSLKTRKSALFQLQRRRAAPLVFPLDGDPQERARIAARWARTWKLPDTLLEEARELARGETPRLDVVRFNEIRDHLEALPATGESNLSSPQTEWFLRLTDSDLLVLERTLESAPPAQAQFLLHEVLPRVSPAYGALVLLESADVNVRRRGAQSLRELGMAASLSPAVLSRLGTTMKREQDQLVWRSIMQGGGQDGSDGAGQLALLAINHQWPDVRVLGCEYVGRHGRSAQAAWLLPLIHDANRQVQLAAVDAAGRCSNVIVIEGIKSGDGEAPRRGLRTIMASSHDDLRLAAAVAMSRLGDGQAMQELVRMSFDASPMTRAAVVQAMGDSGQTRFIEPLVRLAWTETNQRVRQLAVGSLKQLVPAGEQPRGLASAQTLAQTIDLWAAWWQDRRATAKQ